MIIRLGKAVGVVLLVLCAVQLGNTHGPHVRNDEGHSHIEECPGCIEKITASTGVAEGDAGVRVGRQSVAPLEIWYFVGDGNAVLPYTGLNHTSIYAIPGTDKVALVTTDHAVVLNLGKTNFDMLSVETDHAVVLQEEGQASLNRAGMVPERQAVLWRMGTTAIVSIPASQIGEIALCRHSIQIRMLPKQLDSAEHAARSAFISETWSNGGQVAAPPSITRSGGEVQRLGTCSSNAKGSVLGALDMTQYAGWVRGLSGADPITVTSGVFGGQTMTLTTRYASTSHEAAAAEWLADQCRALGATVEVHNFDILGAWLQTVPQRNVICKKHPSSGPTSTIFVVGAHYDSTSESKISNAPGAVDNGSGAAAVLAILAAMQGVDVAATTHFVLFGAEEVGLIGSDRYVKKMVAQGVTIMGALIMDMIGYSNAYYGMTIEYQGVGMSAETDGLRKQMGANAFQYGNGLDTTPTDFTYVYATRPWGSDHIPFITAGIPAVLSIQRDDVYYSHYHRSSDTVATINYDLASAIMRTVLATVYDYTCSFSAVSVTPAPTPAPATTKPAVTTKGAECTPGGHRGIRPTDGGTACTLE